MEPINVCYHQEYKSTSYLEVADTVLRGDTVLSSDKVIQCDNEWISPDIPLKCSRKCCRLAHKPFLDPYTVRFPDLMLA